MKTIRHWLKDGLSEEDYRKAEKYASEYWEEGRNCFEDALSAVFVWGDTQEGHDYWAKIHYNGGSPQTDPIVQAVCEDLMNRSKLGIKKYGKTLDRDDMDAEDWAREMFHELLDAALYCKRLIQELEKTKH